MHHGYRFEGLSVLLIWAVFIGLVVIFDDAARRLQDAEAYRERVVADAEGESSRFEQLLAEYKLAPELPVLARNLCKDQNDCRWTRCYIKELFPGGAKTACRYAGLPTPVGRSCG